MKKSTKIILLSFEGVTFLFTFISFSMIWTATDISYYSGFNIVQKFASDISMGTQVGINIVFLVCWIVLLPACIAGIILTGYKAFKIIKDEKYINEKLNFSIVVLITVMYPFLAIFLITTMPGSEYWAYKFFMAFPFVSSIFAIPYNTTEQDSGLIAKSKEQEVTYKDYNEVRSIYFQKVSSIMLSGIIFMIMAMAKLSNMIKVENVLSMFAFYLPLIGIVLFGAFIFLYKNAMHSRNDYFQYIRYAYSFVLIICISMMGDLEGVLFRMKYVAYGYTVLNMVMAIYYLKNLKLRFYMGWASALFIIFYSILVL
ncbi:hypothetical protein ACFL6D_03465 [Spirochaetota bacterium]